MIAIIVPVHNAEDRIDACLESLVRAARHPALADDDVQITVVLDRCDDRTGWLARSWGVHTMNVQAGNLAAARKAGADAALRAGARWLAFADPDALVSEDWLAAQVAQGSDMVCRAVVDGALDTEHPSFKAASFGLSAKAYLAASQAQSSTAHNADDAVAPVPVPGGFQPGGITLFAGRQGAGGAIGMLQAPFSSIKF